ncbi:GNAT family N-acetyltransferase [Nonomuraea sp. NPDC050310]|uniref:GNAT family N-acetyltransferase n=1 Tax=Nonomuraea sp. NPDC050310 TaxID=3154935 RepID=UPI0033FE57BE
MRRATPADRGSLYALWAACFPGSAHVRPLYESDPGRYERTFVAGAPGAVVASVYYLPRAVRDGLGGVLRVGGVANVATLPEARGQGLARRLLEAACAAMTADGCAWSLLFTGTPEVYAGWESFSLPLVSGPLAPPVAGAPPLRRAHAADRPELAALYERHNAGRPLTTVRDQAHWAVRVPVWYGEPVEVLVHSGGYAAVRWSGDGLEVLEVAGETASVFASLTALAARRGVTRVRARVSWAESGLPYLLGEVRRESDRTGMARPLLADPAPVVRAPGATHWPADYF